MNNNFSNEKIQFYDKIGNKYYHSLLKYKKKFPNSKDFKKNVINWLFSNDEEIRMILCSIENKKYTNIIKEAYNKYDKCKYVKFFLNDNEDEKKAKLYHISNSKLISNNSHDYYLKEMNLFNDIKFYQCESSICDYSKYSNYFSFYNVLKNNLSFSDTCDYFTNDKFLECPIEIEKDFNKNIGFPEWLFKDNIPENMKYYYTGSETNINLYYSLPKFIIALLEQVLCVRYIIFYDSNNLESILSSIYLYELFQKRNNIIKYLTPKENKFSYLYFKIDEQAKKLYEDEKLEEFINNKSIEENSIFSIDNLGIYFNKDDDINNIIRDGNNFFNKFLKDNIPKDFIEFFLYLNIKQIFTYDDFYFRSIFEKIYETYLNQNIKDLIFEDENKKEKKKKKKKKKKNENNENIKINIENNNKNQKKEKPMDFGDEVLKILAEANINEDTNITNKIEDKSDEINNNNENNNDNKNIEITINFINEEEKSLINTFIKNLLYEELFKQIKIIENQKYIIFKNEKKKNKEFFLFDAKEKNKKIKNKKEKNKKIIKESNEKIEKNAEENNIIQENKIKKEPIPSHINSFTFLPVKNENNLTENLDINNDIIKIEKTTINSSKNFKVLNESIIEFNNILEEALIIQRKIKDELVNYFSLIVKIVYQNANLLIYGSSLYNLDIDTSDLDLSISTKENISLVNLENYLKDNNTNNQYTKLNGIFSASVPIIKLEIDYLKIENDEIKKLYELLKETNYYKKFENKDNENYMNRLNIDISLNSINNKQIEFIKVSLSEYPEMRPIIKIIKKILQLKNMNNSYHGGMSSYCLFLLIYSYFKFYYKQIDKNQNKEINYGLLLIGILSFYINYIDFNYTKIDPSLDIPFINEYSLEAIPTVIEPISKQNAAKTIYKIFDVMDCLRNVYEDIFLISEINSDNNLIFQLLEEYSKN